MKVILDCNIWISFLIGHQAEWMGCFLTDPRFEVYVCDALLDEIGDVGNRPKIRARIDETELEDLFRIVYAYCRIAKIESQAQSNIRDPKDLYLLSLAESVGADYIVSGDADLLALQKHKNTKMMSLADFKTMVTDRI